MSQIGVFSPRDAARVAEATRRVLGHHRTDGSYEELPYIAQPTFRAKITGTIGTDGLYPGRLMVLVLPGMTWRELGACRVLKVDTI